MWNEIENRDDLFEFLDIVSFFHDSCIKEIKYLSGAYVDDDLSMYPVNDSRILSIVIQRQFENIHTIEMRFEKLKFLKLYPVDDSYTCEIHDATLLWKDECIWWCDCGGLSEADIADYNGTVICASKLRWRSIENHMGRKAFYHSDV